MNGEDKTKGKPGAGGGTKDLEELKARLGLKKPAPKEAAAGGARPAKSADDFKFAFVGQSTRPEGVSDKELAALEAMEEKATRPGMTQKALFGVGAVIFVLLFMWLGYQFGTSMGMRRLNNAAAQQAQDIQKALGAMTTDAEGLEAAAKRAATESFKEAFFGFVEKNGGQILQLQKLFENDALPKEFDFLKWKQEVMDPLKKICEDYLNAVAEYNPTMILGGQLFAPELGAKLIDFSDRANKLRLRVEMLVLAIQLFESHTLPTPPPSDLQAGLLLYAHKGEGDADKVIPALPVKRDGDPEADKEVVSKEVCQPLSMELEIPVCDAPKGQPNVEKRTLDVFEKKQVDEVKPFRKLKVRSEADNKPLVARFEALYEFDLKPYLLPVLQAFSTQKAATSADMAMLLGTVIQGIADVQVATEGVNYQEVLDAVSQMAAQDKLFTL